MPFRTISNTESLANDPPRRPGADLEVALRASGLARPAPSAPPSRNPAKPDEWSALVDVIRKAGGEFKAGQQQLADQNTRIQDLARRIREELGAAEARAQAAEERAQAAEARAQAAEARAQQAETLATAMLDWRERLYDTVVSEFSLAKEDRSRKAA